MNTIEKKFQTGSCEQFYGLFKGEKGNLKLNRRMK
jgi:hypothetical protein